MRIFQTLPDLIEEIRRDISKGADVISSRVQHEEIEKPAKELLNYQYTIDSAAVPNDTYGLARLGAEYFDAWSHIATMSAWLSIESQMRIRPLAKTQLFGKPSEAYHPSLAGMAEGGHWAYTYRERCLGLLASMEVALSGAHQDSRRAFWPIYHPLDAVRASQLTRIPCTIGYSFLVREVPMLGPRLHVTNLQRSCDFNTFLLSDLYFTAVLQRELGKRLGVKPGLITHSIISLHAFIEGEIY